MNAPVPDLLQAAKDRSSDDLRALLLAGADPDLRDAEGETALTWAAHLGHTPIVKDLLAGGANIALWGERFQAPPLVLAAAGGHYGIVALLAVLSDIEAADSTGATALMRAVEFAGNRPRVRERAAAVIERLLASGAKPDTTDPAGDTALIRGVRAGNLDAVRILLEAGADPDLQNQAGESGRSLANKTGLWGRLKNNED